MRAMTFRSYGGPENLTLVDIARPTPGPGQILVRVLASSVNPVDWKRASGIYRLIMPVSFPAVPGYDVAGEVVEVGPGVDTFAIGDRVHARIGDMRGGASAEFAVVGVDVTAPVPAGMEMGEAAGLPLAGMTALQGLRDRAGLAMNGASERVLIVGASGGVGHLAVQIARAAGATVVGVCSGRNTELVASLGAHDVIDYTQKDPYRGQAPFDVLLDCVAGDPSRWLPLLAVGGRYVSCVPTGKTLLRSMFNAVTRKKVRAVMLKSRAVDLRFLDGLCEAGKLRVVVDRRFKLEELAQAWERSISGRATGKIVIEVG
jgi:2-desacetyl-2-hydroxyethyl bacteriochlorophyllide A dehydrogenase